MLSILRIVIVSYVGLCLVVYFCQEKLIFHPTKLPKDYNFQFKGDFAERVVKSGDDEIHGLVFKQPESKGVILYFHGNAGALDSWGGLASEISQAYGWDVWIIDYPGFGKSTGKIRTQDQLLKMAEDVYGAVKKEYPSAKVILFGRSIGSGLSVYLASKFPATAVMLETPYTSLLEVAQGMYPLLPTVLLKYPVPSIEWIKDVKVPILVVHGTEDEVLPYDLGKRLSEANKNAKLVSLPGGQHNNLSAYEDYWNALDEFIKAL